MSGLPPAAVGQRRVRVLTLALPQGRLYGPERILTGVTGMRSRRPWPLDDEAGLVARIAARRMAAMAHLG